MGKGRGGMKKLVNKVYLQNKEELTHTQAGRPRWDESFFKQAKKEDKRGSDKY